MRKSHWLALLAAVAVPASMAACGGSSSEHGTNGAETSASNAAGTKRIGVFVPPVNSYGQAQLDEARAWGKANGAEITVYDTQPDPQKQYAQIQDVVSQRKLDGIVFFPMNGPALAPLVKKAADAGIASVAVDAPLDANFASTEPRTPGLAGLVWTPAARRGELAAEQAARACKDLDPCKVAFVGGQASFPAVKAQKEAYEAAIKKHPEVGSSIYVESSDPVFSRATGIKVTQDMLQTHPDVNVILSLDDMLLGSEVALKTAGKKWGTGSGEIRLASLGGSTQAVERVRDGQWSSTQLSVPKQQMEDALSIVAGAIENPEQAPKGADPVTTSGLPVVLDKAAIDESGFEGQFNAG